MEVLFDRSEALANRVNTTFRRKLFSEEMLLANVADVDILLNEFFEYQKSTK